MVAGPADHGGGLAPARPLRSGTPGHTPNDAKGLGLPALWLPEKCAILNFQRSERFSIALDTPPRILPVAAGNPPPALQVHRTEVMPAILPCSSQHCADQALGEGTP